MDIPNTRFTEYGKLISESWHMMWKRPISIFPPVYTFITQLLLVLTFGIIGVGLFGSLLEPGFSAYGSLVTFVLIAFIAFLFIGAHFMALSAVVYYRLMKKLELSIPLAFKEAAGLYWRAFKLQLALLVVFLPLFIFIMIIVQQAIRLYSGFVVESILIIAVAVILFFILAFFMGAWLIFVHAILAGTDLKAWENIKTCWQLLVRDSTFVWSIFGIVFGINIVVSMGISFVILPLQFIRLEWLGEIINMAASILLSVWLSLVTYGAYIKRYAVK